MFLGYCKEEAFRSGNHLAEVIGSSVTATCPLPPFFWGGGGGLFTQHTPMHDIGRFIPFKSSFLEVKFVPSDLFDFDPSAPPPPAVPHPDSAFLGGEGGWGGGDYLVGLLRSPGPRQW